MRLFQLTTCLIGWLAAAGGNPDDERPQPTTVKDLIVGKWEDPKAPGNWLDFHQDGACAASIRAGPIKSNVGGSYRILDDGSLEIKVKLPGALGGQESEALQFGVRVTKETLTLVDKTGKESSYRRTR